MKRFFMMVGVSFTVAAASVVAVFMYLQSTLSH